MHMIAATLGVISWHVMEKKVSSALEHAQKLQSLMKMSHLRGCPLQLHSPYCIIVLWRHGITIQLFAFEPTGERTCNELV